MNWIWAQVNLSIQTAKQIKTKIFFIDVWVLRWPIHILCTKTQRWRNWGWLTWSRTKWEQSSFMVWGLSAWSWTPRRDFAWHRSPTRCSRIILTTRFTTGEWPWASPVSSAPLYSWRYWGEQEPCQYHLADAAWSHGGRLRDSARVSSETILLLAFRTTLHLRSCTTVPGVVEDSLCRDDTTHPEQSVSNALTVRFSSLLTR